jgi:hypothetical protein
MDVRTIKDTPTDQLLRVHSQANRRGRDLIEKELHRRSCAVPTDDGSAVHMLLMNDIYY